MSYHCKTYTYRFSFHQRFLRVCESLDINNFYIFLSQKNIIFKCQTHRKRKLKHSIKPIL